MIDTMICDELSMRFKTHASIDGLPDPGGSRIPDLKTTCLSLTSKLDEEKRGQFSPVVGGLLVIAFVVPMELY